MADIEIDARWGRFQTDGGGGEHAYIESIRIDKRVYVQESPGDFLGPDGIERVNVGMGVWHSGGAFSVVYALDGAAYDDGYAMAHEAMRAAELATAQNILDYKIE